MNHEQQRIATECADLSEAGKIHFGDLVGRLMAAGIERYHSDYSRMETTFYTADGGSLVHSMHAAEGAARTTVEHAFSAARIQAAIRQAQRGEIMFPEFTRLAMSAGCVGYFVQIAGKRVQYFGRNGDMHTEWFPGAQPQ